MNRGLDWTPGSRAYLMAGGCLRCRELKKLNTVGYTFDLAVLCPSASITGLLQIVCSVIFYSKLGFPVGFVRELY